MARNLLLFAIIAVGGGFVGIAIDQLSPPQDRLQGLGALLWLIAPLVANLFLRTFGGDGWQDFGLRPNLVAGRIWYLAALLIVPGVILLTLGVSTLFGTVSLSGFTEQGFGAFLSLTGIAFGMAMVKNIFEEFAWRGYLTPRFEALQMHPFVSSLLTGFIWAGWHIPYYLYYLDQAARQQHTSLSAPELIMIALFVLPFQALAYGELRLLSKSVWSAWLMHTTANAISLTLVSGGFVVVASGFVGILLAPGTEGILHSLFMGMIGLGLYRYRASRKARQRTDKEIHDQPIVAQEA